MRVSRFYSERINLRVGSSVKLREEDSVHIRKVLRLKSGDKVILFNGEKEFEADLYLVSKDAIMARVTKVTKVEDFSGESQIEITLIQGLLKAGKFELIVEKLTEIGIDNIVPLECEYSQAKADRVLDKVDRWQRIAIASSKQSERVRIPEILVPIKFNGLKDIKSEFDQVFVFTIPRENLISSSEVEVFDKKLINEKSKHIAYMIGPEGGFSPKEHEILKELGFQFVTLPGNNILRSETAALVVGGVLRFVVS